jgi:L-alanine-DL-glutamate epimerase-like enolase superfamily enzyme
MTGTVVDRVEAAVYTVDTDAPEGDGTLTWDSTTMVLARVEVQGRVGVGYTYGPGACAAVIRDELRPVVVGCDPMDVPGANVRMSRAVRNAGRAGVVSCAISAVDIALWDLKAKLLALPLHRLLGSVRSTIPVYGSGGFTTYDDERLRDQLGGWVLKQEIPRVKIKIGESWGAEENRDLARMRTAREVVGPDVELFVDANGAYARKQAVRVMERAQDLDVRWFEEPVSSDDLDGLRHVRESVRCEVTAGEYGYDLSYFQRMCAAQAVDCLQVDVTRCGGITEWRRVAAVAAGHGLEVSGHCAPHVHAAVAAATPNLRHLEWFHDHVRIESIFFDGTLDPTGGRITPDPDAPGLGITLREVDAERYRRDDGTHHG